MNLGQNSLRFWYYRFKDSPYFSLSLVLVTILVCFILLLQVIIPQVSKWFSVREEIEATNERIEVIRKNINFINNLDRGRLSADLETVTTALPPVKNFGGVLHAISASSLKAGVSLEDYSFNVGNVSTGSAAVEIGRNVQPDGGLSAIDLTIDLTGSVEGIRNFLKEIEEKLPIGEVIKLDSDSQSTSLEIKFYVKDIPKLSFQAEQNITPLSESERLLLQRINSWKQSGEIVEQGGEEIPIDPKIPLF